jgi:succinyl-CoA synthetase beta subunit
MKIHEYQAKAIFRRFGVTVPEGRMASTPEEAQAIATELGGHPGPQPFDPIVVKAQIHAGGRGKAGGVKLVQSAEAARDVAASLIGRTLVTHQTGPQGKEVLKVLVEKASRIRKEFYLSLVTDRAAEDVAIIASAEGGMEIEEVARTRPEAILTEHVCPLGGYSPHIGRTLGRRLGLSSDLLAPFAKLLGGLYRVFTECDASMVEVNPLILTEEGALVALDGKITFDDNSLYRHPDLAELRDLTEEDPREVEASQHDLNYIKLEGQVGCMVNGAGLAMATMDIIQHHGSSPANFLDVGGTATAERVEAAFRLLLGDPNVKAVLVNIFGGIVRCDVVAKGIVEAARKVDLTVPLVVRLQGTNADEGRQILKDSGLPLTPAVTLDDAARAVVAAVKGA